MLKLNNPIVIIGGGIGGLSTAIRLSAQGFPVTLFEKNQKVGGKMAEIHQDGFRWDIGPSVITMRDVIEDLFQAAGKQLEDYIQLLPLDPLTRYFYPNGREIDINRDLPQTLASISSIHPKEVEGYLSFLSYAARQFRITSPVYTYGPPPSWESIKNLKLKDLPGIDVFRNLASAINTHVLSPELRQLLARFATYVGSDPYKAPALLSVIAHVELAQGVWYPKGGVYTLAEALERIAIEKGVNIYTNRTVVEILVLDKSVKGVRLEDGSIIESNLVISNVDTATAYSKLLPSKTPYIREQGKMVTSPLSFSAFIILLGVNGINENLEHHNIFFSKDYQEEFRQLAYGLPPDDPTIYVAITSKTDIHHAPMNCENWFVMVNVAPLKEGDDWNKHKEKYKQQILNTFKEYGYDLTNRVVTERIITPVDLEFNSGSYRGALYGINFNKWNAPFLRPKPQDKHIRGLYHVGGTTHPGGGVPMVMLSAKTVAKLVENNIKLKG